MAGHQVSHPQSDNLFPAVFQYNVVITLHQVIPAAVQRPQGGHARRVKLLAPRNAQLIIHFHPETGVVLSGFALALLRAEGQQRHRGVGQPRRDGVGITLPVILVKQRHFVPVVLFINQLPAQLRQRRQPALQAHIPAVGRTLLVILDIRGVFPPGQAEVVVGRHFEEIPPVLHTDPAPGVVMGPVVIPEGVHPQHPAVIKPAVAETQVGLGPVISPVHTALREQQACLAVI